MPDRERLRAKFWQHAYNIARRTCGPKTAGERADAETRAEYDTRFYWNGDLKPESSAHLLRRD